MINIYYRVFFSHGITWDEYLNMPALVVESLMNLWMDGEKDRAAKQKTGRRR